MVCKDQNNCVQCDNDPRDGSPPSTSPPTHSVASGGKGKGSRSCLDRRGFRDGYGTCDEYAARGWCAFGNIGPHWEPSWGSLGVDVRESCCVCGRASTPAPTAAVSTTHACT